MRWTTSRVDAAWRLGSVAPIRFGTALAAVLVALTPGAVASTTLTWWSWDSDATRAAYAPALDAFTKQSGIHVDIRHVDWSALPQALQKAVAGGTVPDVVSVSSTWFAPLAAAGVFRDLFPLIVADDSGYDFNDIFAASYKLWQAAGHQYALPLDNDISAMFYNQHLLEGAGVGEPGADFDWATLMADVRKLTQDTNGDGRLDRFGYSSYWTDWVPYVWADGGEIFDAKGHLALNAPAAMAALSFYAGLYPAQSHALITATDAMRLGYRSVPAAWQAGIVGFAPAGSWMPQYWIYDSARKGYAFPFDVANMPWSPIKQRSTTIQGQGVAITAAGTHATAAWKLLKFLAAPSFQEILAGQGQFPVRRSVAVSPAFLPAQKPPQHKSVFIAAADYSRPLPKQWPKARAVVEGRLAHYFSGQSSLTSALADAAGQLK